MFVHIITVKHEYGMNCYVSQTHEGVRKQLADYVRDWWGDLGIDEPFNEQDPDESIRIYFDEHPNPEWYEEFTEELF